MKCYYTVDPKTLKKVFIPMCMGTIHSHDKRDCCCEDPLTEHTFEKIRFNEVLKKKNESIAEYQAEIKNLHNVIKNLKQKLK